MFPPPLGEGGAGFGTRSCCVSVAGLAWSTVGGECLAHDDVFFDTHFRWGEGNRKNSQSLPCCSFLCKTWLAGSAYPGWYELPVYLLCDSLRDHGHAIVPTITLNSWAETNPFCLPPFHKGQLQPHTTFCPVSYYFEYLQSLRSPPPFSQSSSLWINPRTTICCQLSSVGEPTFSNLPLKIGGNPARRRHILIPALGGRAAGGSLGARGQPDLAYKWVGQLGLLRETLSPKKINK